MKGAIALVALLAVPSHADPARKAVPAKFKKAASELFRQAVEADDKGKKWDAIQLYKKAYEIAPHANIAYNLAELQERTGELRDAVYSYELYLALSPRAPDEKKLRAKIVAVESMPTTLELVTGSTSFDFAPAYIMIDGDLVHKPGTPGPFKYKVMPGEHLVDVITPVTSASQRVEVSFGGGGQPVRMQFDTVVDANVFITALGTLYVDGNTVESYKPGQKLAAGRYRATVDDRHYECPPFTVEAPKGDDVVSYVHVRFVELLDPKLDEWPRRCRKQVVKLQKLNF